MGDLLQRRKLLLAEVEGSYGTDPVPVPATDSVLIFDLAWSNESLKMAERPAVRPSLGALQQIYGGRLVTASFKVEMKGSGTAGTAPEMSKLLRGCALGETVDPGVSVIYAPVSVSAESITLYIYEDGKLIKLTGCRGNLAPVLESKNIGMFEFKFTGHVSAQTDVALPTPTYSAIDPVTWVGGSFVVDGFSAGISSLSFDLGNELLTPDDVNGADGFGEVSSGPRNVAGSFDPLDTLVATEDWLGNFTSGALMALTTGAIGSVGGNIVTIAMPAVYYLDVSPQDRGGVAAFDIPFGATESTTDDEISIAFT